MKDLEKEHMPKKKKKKGWFSWGRSEAAEEDALGADSTAAATGDPSATASSTTVTTETAEQEVRLLHYRSGSCLYTYFEGVRK